MIIIIKEKVKEKEEEIKEVIEKGKKQRKKNTSQGHLKEILKNEQNGVTRKFRGGFLTI